MTDDLEVRADETLAETVARLLPHIDYQGKGVVIAQQLSASLARERTLGPEYAKKAEEIRLLAIAHDSEYAARAVDGIARSWELTDPACQALALADAQVWATLQLAEVTQLDTLDRIASNVVAR